MHQALRDEPGPGMTLPVLHNLVYCSRAVSGVDDADVARIIESSHRRNPAQGITGLLVFGSGIFFQWLEGPRDNVQALMAMLKSDNRHDNVVVLSEAEEVGERLFPGWDMELVEAEDIREVLTDALDNAGDAQNAAALRGLLAHLDGGELAHMF